MKIISFLLTAMLLWTYPAGAQTLEENCNLNDTAARAAAIDAECNERFICSQMSKKEQYDEAINQVDSILNLAYEESRGRGRAA